MNSIMKEASGIASSLLLSPLAMYVESLCDDKNVFRRVKNISAIAGGLYAIMGATIPFAENSMQYFPESYLQREFFERSAMFALSGAVMGPAGVVLAYRAVQPRMVIKYGYPVAALTDSYEKYL